MCFQVSGKWLWRREMGVELGEVVAPLIKGEVVAATVLDTVRFIFKYLVIILVLEETELDRLTCCFNICIYFLYVK